MVAKWIALTGVLVAAACSPATATAPEEIRVYLVKQCGTPPKLDGTLDDPCWAKAEMVDDFGYAGYGHGNRSLPVPRTQARFLWDSRYLYIALVAFDNNIDAVRRVVSNPGASICWRDLFEIHVDANHDRKTRYQLMANPNGERYVDTTLDRGYTIEHESSWGLWADWTVRARYGTDRWTVEIRVSLADMGCKPRPGTHMGLNVARFRFVQGMQFLTWNGQGGSHHDLNGFAAAILVGPGKTTSVSEALRLAYPDIGSRVVRLLRRDGYTILDHGKAHDLTFAQTVAQEVGRARDRLAVAAKAVATAPCAPNDRKLFEQMLQKERQTIDKIVAEAAKDGKVGYVSCRKALAGLAPIAERVVKLDWQIKALVLGNALTQ